MEASYQDQAKKVNNLIKGIKVAMLTTMDAEGFHARPMVIHSDSNFEEGLFFLTQQDTSKVKELNHNEKVSVTLSDPSKNIFIALSGTASVSEDQERIHQICTEMDSEWFSDCQSTGQLRLITVIPEFVEYWESPSSKFKEVSGILRRITGKPKLSKEHEVLTLKDISPI